MSGQNFGERIDRSEILENTDQEMDGPVVNTNLYGESMPVEAVFTPVPDVIETQPAAVETDEMAVQMAPQTEVLPVQAPAATVAGSPAALLDHEVSEHLRARWGEIQAKFVDEPRSAVQEADALVSEVVTQITQMFDSEHTSLESQWKQGEDVSTEDLRKALQHYRSFFNRLVV